MKAEITQHIIVLELLPEVQEIMDGYCGIPRLPSMKCQKEATLQRPAL